MRLIKDRRQHDRKWFAMIQNGLMAAPLPWLEASTLTGSKIAERIQGVCAAEAIFCCPTQNSRHLEA